MLAVIGLALLGLSIAIVTSKFDPETAEAYVPIGRRRFGRTDPGAFCPPVLDGFYDGSSAAPHLGLDAAERAACIDARPEVIERTWPLVIVGVGVLAMAVVLFLSARSWRSNEQAFD